MPKGVAARLLTGQLLTAGTALIINVLSARSLGPEGRGALAVFLQLSYILIVFCIAGVDRSYPATRGRTGLPRYTEAVGEMLRLTLAPIGICLAATVCIPLLPVFGASRAILFGGVLALVVLGGALLMIIRTAAISAGAANTFLATTVGSQALLLATAVTFTITGVEDPLIWLLSYGLTALAPAVAAALIRKPSRGADFSAGKRRARLAGLRLMPSTLANIVTLRSDRLLLPAVAGSGQLGLYIVVASITETIGWPIQAYVDAHIPAWAKEDSERRLHSARVLLTAICYSAVAVVIVGFATSGLIVPVFGHEYKTSVALVWPLTIAAGLFAFSRVGVGLGVARSQAPRVAVVEIGSMLVALAAYLVLIPAAGAAGAAWACVIGYGSGAVFASLAALAPARRRAQSPKQASPFVGAAVVLPDSD